MRKIKLYPHQVKALKDTEGFNKCVFKPIKGYEGLYSISSNGDVISMYNAITLKPHIKNGYSAVNLYKEKRCKHFYVHRLVAEVFILNANNYPEVNHIDGNKQNNSVKNLEWCTSSQNQIHAFKIGLQKPNPKVHLGNNYRGIKCQLVNNLTKEIIEFKQMKKASEFLGHYKDFIYRKHKKQGNLFISNGYTVKVGDAICQR